MNSGAPGFTRIDMRLARLEGVPAVERRLSDMRGLFADHAAFEAALAVADPVIYRVTSVAAADGAGDLHYALGMIMPGRVGAEYYMTRGHVHAWHPAAEVYIGLQGEGMMLLEDEVGGASELVPLVADSVVYVPGSTAHRTCNTADAPLVYLGVYPARAGHDYEAIARRNFRKVVIAREGQPALIDREAFGASLEVRER